MSTQNVATDPSLLSINKAALLIRERKLSPLELVKSTLDRIKNYESRVNAFITLTEEMALDSAREAESLIQHGKYLGSLHGIPVALKDVYSTARIPTTVGSRIMSDWIPKRDARVVQLLKDAGAIVIGKLNMHEFSFGASNINPHYGTVRNPWDYSRITGGSSGGSGAAVAASFCLGALGSDAGGSIRIPSSLCGIVGLKPTYGLVSLRGVVTTCPSQDTVGPMGKCVEDIAILLSTIAGYDELDPYSIDKPSHDFVECLSENISSLQIGVPSNYFIEMVNEDVMSAFTECLSIFRDLDAQIKEVKVPYAKRAADINGILIISESAAFHAENLNESPHDFGEDVRSRLSQGAKVTTAEYIHAMQDRKKIIRAFNDLFKEIDILLTPTTPVPAPSIEEALEKQVIDVLPRFTRPFSCTGNPAISIPCGFTSGGLPIGLQMISQRFCEKIILKAAYNFEQATEWHTRQPHLN